MNYPGIKGNLITGIMLLLLGTVYAQDKDAILGKWQSGHGSGQIEIYIKSGKYFGKIVWLKEPNDSNGKPLKDIHNPSATLRSQPIIGLEILKGFVYDDDNSWKKGTIYDPKSGKTYSSKMSLASNDRLNIRGYVGVSFIGKTETWTRVP